MLLSTFPVEVLCDTSIYETRWDLVAVRGYFFSDPSILNGQLSDSGKPAVVISQASSRVPIELSRFPDTTSRATDHI